MTLVVAVWILAPHACVRTLLQDHRYKFIPSLGADFGLSFATQVNFFQKTGILHKYIDIFVFFVKLKMGLKVSKKGERESMKQRFLSIFLVLALIIPFFPQVTLPAKAAETTAKTQDENSNDRDHKEGSIGSITDGTRTGKKEEGNKNGFTIMDTAPVDAKGEGQKRYVAVLGYWLGGKRLELYIADKDGNRVSNTYAIGGEKTLDYLEQADAFEDTGFVSVAAGDFNGDGKDTVIAYAPLMESDSEQPQLWEFSIGSNMR